MGRIELVCLLAAGALALGACSDGGATKTGGGGGTGTGTETGARSFSEADAAYHTLLDTFAAYNGGDTAIANLASGTASYQGMVRIIGNTDSVIRAEMLGDLGLIFDLNDPNRETTNGVVHNISTNLPGFETPDGTLAVAGDITSDGGLAVVEFFGLGTLTQGDNVIEVGFDGNPSTLEGPNGEWGGGTMKVVLTGKAGDYDAFYDPVAGGTWLIQRQ